MPKSYGLSGAMAGVGAGMGQAGDMIFRNHLQNNNPYVRLAAMRGMQGGSALRGTGTGATGGAADVVSSRINPSYGQPGHPGGMSDPEGRFDETKMPMNELLGDPGRGLNERNAGMADWQRGVVPVAKQYIKVQGAYNKAILDNKQQEEKWALADQVDGEKLIELGLAQKRAATPEESQAVQDAIFEVRLRKEQRKMLKEQAQQGLREMEAQIADFGGKLAPVLDQIELGPKGLMVQQTRTVDQIDPRSITQGTMKTYGADGAVRSSRPFQSGDFHGLGSDQTRERYMTKPTMRPATPMDIGQKIFPPGQVPADMAMRGYY